jgi:hypothetical protein
MTLPKGTLGPGILGQEQYEREIVETTRGASIFGPGILGYDPQKVELPGAEPEEELTPTKVPDPVVPEDFTFPDMGLPDLRDTLIGNEYLLDSAIEREFQREPEPRRGALRLFIEIESEGEKREEVLQRLGDALG